MIAFIVNNLATIIVGLIVFAIIAAVAIKLIRDHKNKKSSCGCSCADCPSAGNCHDK